MRPEAVWTVGEPHFGIKCNKNDIVLHGVVKTLVSSGFGAPGITHVRFLKVLELRVATQIPFMFRNFGYQKREFSFGVGVPGAQSIRFHWVL